MDHGGVNHQIVVDEFCAPSGVRQNATHGTGDEENILRPIEIEPLIDRRLVTQIKLLPSGGQ